MFALIKNNIRLLLARKSLILTLVILPVVLMAISLMIEADGRDYLKIGVVDHDRSVVSTRLTEELASVGNETEAMTAKVSEEKLIESEIEAVLTIPAGFEDEILAGGKPRVTITSVQGQEIVTMTRAQINIFLNALQTIVAIEQPADAKALIESSASLRDEGVQFQIDRSEHQVRRGLSVSSGLLIYLLSINMIQIGQLIQREKAWKTQDRIKRAPVSRWGYLLANVATGLIFLLINLVSIYLIGTFLLQLRTTPEMYLVWLIYGLVWIAIGIWLALIVPTTSLSGNIRTILTTIGAMLGGSFWPIYLMPDFMRKVAAITPQYWANQWLDSVQKGAGFMQKPHYLIALLGFLVLFLALGIFSLARRRNSQAFI